MYRHLIIDQTGNVLPVNLGRDQLKNRYHTIISILVLHCVVLYTTTKLLGGG